MIAMNGLRNGVRRCRHGLMSLPDEILDKARAAYVQVTEDYARYKWLTDQRCIDQLRDYLRGKRKSANAEMMARLSEYAAWSGLLPADPQIAKLALAHVAEWNSGLYGAHFALSRQTTDTQSLARGYLSEIRTHDGRPNETRLKSISTWALDSAALTLKPHCPFAWCVAGNDDVEGSPAQRWLLTELMKVEPRIDEAVVRALITRTSPP